MATRTPRPFIDPFQPIRGKLLESLTPTSDDEVIVRNSPASSPTFGRATLSAVKTLFGSLDNVVEDTTPQLGGNLDVNGQKIVSVSDGNIDIEPNGTGNVLIGNLTFDADQTVGSGQDTYFLTYDNSSGLITLQLGLSGDVLIYRSGEYYYAGHGEFSVSTDVLSANTLYAVPIHIHLTTTFTALCVEVTTGSAGNARMGIYEDSSGYPGALVLDGGTADTTSTGFKEIAISQSLARGVYWLVLVTDATPTIRRLGTTALAGLAPFGTNQEADSSSDSEGAVTVAFTYAALPDPFTGSGSYTSTMPRFGLKV